MRQSAQKFYRSILGIPDSRIKDIDRTQTVRRKNKQNVQQQKDKRVKLGCCESSDKDESNESNDKGELRESGDNTAHLKTTGSDSETGRVLPGFEEHNVIENDVVAAAPAFGCGVQYVPSLGDETNVTPKLEPDDLSAKNEIEARNVIENDVAAAPPPLPVFGCDVQHATSTSSSDEMNITPTKLEPDDLSVELSEDHSHTDRTDVVQSNCTHEADKDTKAGDSFDDSSCCRDDTEPRKENSASEESAAANSGNAREDEHLGNYLLATGSVEDMIYGAVINDSTLTDQKKCMVRAFVLGCMKMEAYRHNKKHGKASLSGSDPFFDIAMSALSLQGLDIMVPMDNRIYCLSEDAIEARYREVLLLIHHDKCHMRPYSKFIPSNAVELLHTFRTKIYLKHGVLR